MTDIQEMRKLLADEFGILTDQDLIKALAATPKIDIGVFVSPIKGRGKNHERTHSIA